MSAPDARNLLHIAGKLCINPTDLSTAFPHGGTALGLTRKNRFSPNVRYRDVVGEEFGGVVVEKVYIGERPRFACYIREWDANAVAHIFHNASGSVVTADTTTDLKRGGTLLGGRVAKLYLSPLAPTAAVALLGYAAVASLEASAEMQFAPKEEIGLAVVWDFLPNASGKLYQIGLAAGLSL